MDKKLGLGALISLVIGSMVGAGVFSLPQNIAAHASAGAVALGWAITGIGMVTPAGNDVATTWEALLAGRSEAVLRERWQQLHLQGAVLTQLGELGTARERLAAEQAQGETA